MPNLKLWLNYILRSYITKKVSAETQSQSILDVYPWIQLLDMLVNRKSDNALQLYFFSVKQCTFKEFFKICSLC